MVWNVHICTTPHHTLLYAHDQRLNIGTACCIRLD